MPTHCSSQGWWWAPDMQWQGRGPASSRRGQAHTVQEGKHFTVGWIYYQLFSVSYTLLGQSSTSHCLQAPRYLYQHLQSHLTLLTFTDLRLRFCSFHCIISEISKWGWNIRAQTPAVCGMVHTHSTGPWSVQNESLHCPWQRYSVDWAVYSISVVCWWSWSNIIPTFASRCP